VDELPTPTPRELEILKVLWELGPSTVKAVHRRLAETSGDDPAHNTIQTMLRLMADKKLVGYAVEGRTFIYTPRFSRQESATRFLDRVFDGAASQLMQCLLRAERVPAEELERMHALIAEARRQRAGA
jgi:predicted transcriptional regulator